MGPIMKKRKSHARAPGETQITISLPQSLKDELTALARQDERSRSKWIVRELKKIIERKPKQELAGHPVRGAAKRLATRLGVQSAIFFPLWWHS
jgi:hypothetical protein